MASLALVFALPACGGAVASGVAAGKVGRDLSARADTVPQGAEACAFKDALATQTGAADKPLSDTCAKALKSDQLWQRSMIVLGAYASTLDAIASGSSAETSGPLEAALAGVKSGLWIDVDEGSEKAAREAVSQLVDQMSTSSAKGDLEKAVKDAAPHVKTICTGLRPYLEAQAKSFEEALKELEKKRTTRTDRRCGTLDNRSVCVAESVIDRSVYANLFGHLTALQNSHLDAVDAVSGFCAAHGKMEEAAAKGDLSKDQTYRDIVEAVKSTHRAKSDDAGKSPPKK